MRFDPDRLNKSKLRKNGKRRENGACGKGGKIGGESVKVGGIGALTLFMSNLPMLFPVSAVSVVSYSTPDPVGNGVCGTLGRVGRAGGNWNPNRTYGYFAQPLPNLCPLFLISPVSVVSYPTPNPVGCWEWDVGRSGEEWEEREEIGTLTLFMATFPNLFHISAHFSRCSRIR